jgi:hypothetical protein
MTTSLSQETWIVNRIPPSATKTAMQRSRHQLSGMDEARRSIKHRKPGSSSVALLDPTDPVHMKRIQQRHKAIAMGKSTVGYSAYLKQVPKESRRARSMETPSTPIPTLNIPAKRWQGQVRAW